MPAYALGRGLKTLPLRIARHNANAQAVAEFLRRRLAREPGVLPGPASRIPITRLPQRQMTGFGGMVCFDLDGRYDRAERSTIA